MMSKCMIFFVVAFVAHASSSAIPLASYAIAPIASSYSAHTVNHAIATPVISAPVVTAHAPLLAAPAPLVAAPAPLLAGAAPLAAYSAYPYSAYPYASYLG